MSNEKQHKDFDLDLLVPVAKDGTWFSPHLARSGEIFTLGPKGKEIQVKGFERALEILKKLPVAQWRRPNENGNWGIVSAVGDWKKLGNLMSDESVTSGVSNKDQLEPIDGKLGETEIGQIYGQIKDFYAKRTISAALEGDRLDALVTEILDAVEPGSAIEKLCASAALGYLSAAPSVKNREDVVFGPMGSLFAEVPPPLSVLDVDQRRQAAEALAHTGADWLIEYCAIEAIDEDKGHKPRVRLLWNVLQELGNLADLFVALQERIGRLKQVEDVELRGTRIKKIFEALLEVTRAWTGSCGDTPGETLAELYTVANRGVSGQVDRQIRFEISDYALGILLRIIELRFSFAMSTDTYAVIGASKGNLGIPLWGMYIGKSSIIPSVQKNLLEAMLVLAQQGKEDGAFVELIIDCFGNRSTTQAAISEQLADSANIEPQVKDWWEKAGKVPKRKKAAQQRDDGSVDRQIGALLIEIEDAKEPMEKLGRAVVPVIGISDPILAETVSRAAKGYGEISRIVRQLGRMRKLSVTNNKGARKAEYNRQVHEMLGGHQPGVRFVRVLRNGVQKDFAGIVRTIIKEWVEPADE